MDSLWLTPALPEQRPGYANRREPWALRFAASCLRTPTLIMWDPRTLSSANFLVSSLPLVSVSLAFSGGTFHSMQMKEGKCCSAVQA